MGKYRGVVLVFDGDLLISTPSADDQAAVQKITIA
jgi:hypothetical protein